MLVPPTPPNLETLPAEVIRTMFQLDRQLVPLFLVGLGSKKLHLTSRALVYESLVINDHALSSEPCVATEVSTPRISQLSTVLYGPAEYAECVKTLVIRPTPRAHLSHCHQPKARDGSAEVEEPSDPSEYFGQDDDHSTSSSSESFPHTRTTSSHSPACPLKLASSSDFADQGDHQGLEFDQTLTQLLNRITNLRCFEWNSDQLPMRNICALLGGQCPNLERFVLDLAHPSDTGSSTSLPSLLQNPSSPEPNIARAGHDHGPLTNPWTRPRSNTTSTLEDVDSDSESGVVPSKPIRWDAYAVDCLPATLTHLHISSLSQQGSKHLSHAFQAMTWTALTELKLNNTLFVDDELMVSIAAGSKRIKTIKIESMSGTKLTERGVEVLFNSLEGLEEMEILDVEGRFSKNGWLKLDDLPPTLKSLKFGYHEIGSYHSWTLEHLNNIISLLALYPKQLERLSIKRFVPYPALVPGRHATYPELTVGSRTSPKKMTKEQIMTIVEEGKALKELEIDWWLISVEGLEVIVKGLPDLIKLRVLVDAPFHRIIGSTAFAHSKIRSLTVSIPPEHTPSINAVASPTHSIPCSIPKSSPTSPILATDNPSPSSPHSTRPQPSPVAIVTSPIPVREIKKFIKRASHLKEIIWTGRGGLGNWKFIRNCGSKVEFLPITEHLPPEAFNHEQKSCRRGGHHQNYSQYGSSYLDHGTSLPTSGRRNSSASSAVGNGHRVTVSKRRTSSVTTGSSIGNGFPTHPIVKSDESRRSSEASLQSLSTSWGSSHILNSSMGTAFLQHHSKKANGLLNKGPLSVMGLEGIPGTPSCEPEGDCALDHHELSIEQLNHIDLAFA